MLGQERPSTTRVLGSCLPVWGRFAISSSNICHLDFIVQFLRKVSIGQPTCKTPCRCQLYQSILDFRLLGVEVRQHEGALDWASGIKKTLRHFDKWRQKTPQNSTFGLLSPFVGVSGRGLGLLLALTGSKVEHLRVDQVARLGSSLGVQVWQIPVLEGAEEIRGPWLRPKARTAGRHVWRWRRPCQGTALSGIDCQHDRPVCRRATHCSDRHMGVDVHALPDGRGKPLSGREGKHP